ncbi:MAG: sulfite exporter TauE/SafE family protein [Saprospiraceae bacterium]
MDYWYFLLLIGTGALAGFYSGLVGTGANIVLIPMLDLILSKAGLTGDDLVKAIIAHSLCITLFSGIFISFRQYKAKNFYFLPVLYTALPGMLTASLTTHFIKIGNWFDKVTFDVIFLSMLLLLLLRLFTDRKSGVLEVKTELPPSAYLLTGTLTGIITSLSGFGGGIVMIPFFTDVFKMPIRKASSISIGVIALLAVPISLTYLLSSPDHQAPPLPMQVGYLSFYLILPTLVGIFLFAPLGVKTAQQMTPTTIRLIFTIVVTILCFKMIFTFL